MSLLMSLLNNVSMVLFPFCIGFQQKDEENGEKVETSHNQSQEELHTEEKT